MRYFIGVYIASNAASKLGNAADLQAASGHPLCGMEGSTPYCKTASKHLLLYTSSTLLSGRLFVEWLFWDLLRALDIAVGDIRLPWVNLVQNIRVPWFPRYVPHKLYVAMIFVVVILLQGMNTLQDENLKHERTIAFSVGEPSYLGNSTEETNEQGSM